ncbi:MAG TPA: M56 family peptidase, partial [Candidatus Nesterenkonia stercoripullorum]|nr:M56 family peptidase [Candidatus Nesterenkonia stercoripullorum]
TTRYGRHAVLELTEMLADDGALRDSSRRELLRSLATTATNDPLAAPASPKKRGGATGGDTTAAGESEAGDSGAAQHTGMTGPRLRRLLEPPAPLSVAARAAVLCLAIALLAVPTALMLLP